MSNVQAHTPEKVDDKSSSESLTPQHHLPNDQCVALPPIDYSSARAFFYSTWRRILSLWTTRFGLGPIPQHQLPDDQLAARPPIDYSSARALFHSTWHRFLSLWTRRFVLSLLAGQVVSLCITCTNVTTEELNLGGWQLPTTQTFFLYFTLFLIYTPYTIYKYGFMGWIRLIYKDGWKYIILGACDVEGNFLVVKAYQYTNLLSCMLLDAWAIPVCMFFLYVYMRMHFHWTQLLGALICVAGLGLLVGADQLTNKDWDALDKGKGDGFMILGATLYGFTNATEELFVRRRPLYEVVGQLGMWGVIINGVQASIIEHHKMREMTWSGRNIGLLVAYTTAMFILYTVAPLLYRLASSAYFNLSLLSSDFYGLLFGLFLFHFEPYWLYFPSFAVVIVGLIVYFWHSTPEQQGTNDIRKPSYVDQIAQPNLQRCSIVRRKFLQIVSCGQSDLVPEVTESESEKQADV